MANEGDLAAANEQFHLEVSLAQQQNRGAAGLKKKGICHYCSGPVKPEQLFCDEDCAEDHEYERRRRRANGV
jgi:hypothetical protein